MDKFDPWVLRRSICDCRSYKLFCWPRETTESRSETTRQTVIVDSYFVLIQQIVLGRALSLAVRDATVPQRVTKSVCN